MDNGTFNIWTAYFEEAVYNVDIGHIVNTASFGIFDGLLIISLISRKNRVIVCQVGLEKILDDFLKERKFVYTNGNNFRLLVNLELEVQTPYLPAKSLDKIKLRFHNRIVSLNDQRIILTSKDGNMYLTDIESLMKIKEDKLVVKPAAYEDNENPFYEMLDENPHFKNIYFSKLIGDTYVAIGMDRLVSFWRVSRYKVQYDFNIKCLGSKATKLAVSPLEPQSFLFSCNDRTMRLWNTGKKANRFVTTILWKGLDRRVVRELCFHPKEESIVVIVGEREIALMDIHAHTVISEFAIGEIHEGEVSFTRWLRRDVVEKFIDSRYEAEILKLIKSNKTYKSYLGEKSPPKLASKFTVINNKYVKDLDKKYLFVAYVQNKGFLILDFRLGTIFCLNYKIERFVSSVEVVDLLEEKGVILTIFGDKKGNIFLIRFQNGKFDHLFLDNIHGALISTIKLNTLRLPGAKKEDPQTGTDKKGTDNKLQGKRLLFFSEQDNAEQEAVPKDTAEVQARKEFLEPNPNKFKVEENDILFATGSYDRTIKIVRIKDILKPIKLSRDFCFLVVSLKHKYRISEIDWDPFDSDRLLNICQKHVTAQIWTINPKKQPKTDTPVKDIEGGEDDPYCIANIRGHKGFINAAMWSRFEKDCIITCSDDQSVKIWNLVNIRFKKPPNKKKKESKMGEVVVEQENNEDDDEENEKANQDVDYYAVNKFEKFKAKPQEKIQKNENVEDEEDEDDEFYTPSKA